MKAFYIDTEGNDDVAYKEAIKKAVELCKGGQGKKIILLTSSKGTTGWLDRLYGNEQVKKLYKGYYIDLVPIKIEIVRNYSKVKSSDDIVISMGMDDGQFLKVVDGIAAIFAIPWMKDSLNKWANAWNALELRTNNIAQEGRELHCVTETAFRKLDSAINNTTGINHPSDNNLAKTYIRALKKYDYTLDPDKIYAFLVGNLSWKDKHAKDVIEIINKINAGKSFQGGDKTGLKNHIKNWEKICEEKK